MTRRILALFALALALVSGCGRGTTTGNPTATPPAGTSAPASTPATGGPLPAAISITRTGGFAGVRQSITIQPSGDWIYSGDGGTKQGTLSPAQVASLRDLLTRPAFLAEARQQPTAVCNDGFQYAVTMGTETVTFEDCTLDRPTVEAAMSVIETATPF